MVREVTLIVCTRGEAPFAPKATERLARGGLLEDFLAIVGSFLVDLGRLLCYFYFSCLGKFLFPS